METLKENWVEFRRYHCKSGFIDSWSGDCINSPNDENKNKLSLNSITSYFRLNGKDEWLNRDCFTSNFLHNVRELKEGFSSIEIWNEFKRDLS